jgi:hypothetical protein
VELLARGARPAIREEVGGDIKVATVADPSAT